MIDIRHEIAEMRCQLADCQWEDMTSVDIYNLPDWRIIAAIHAHMGGLKEWCRDWKYSTDATTEQQEQGYEDLLTILSGGAVRC